MALHTINLPIDSPNIQVCIEQLGQGDAVIFLAKGLDTCTVDSPYSETIKALQNSKSISFYCLLDQGSGLEENQQPTEIAVIENVGIINYKQFVHLTVEHDKTISWF